MPGIDYLKQITTFANYEIKALSENPIKNFSKINKLKKSVKSIQALGEGQRDILNTQIVYATQNVGKEVDKNNYPNYQSQVKGAYEMYRHTAPYGGEILGGIVDTRVAFIAGEGLSVIAEDGPESVTQEFINNFLEKNKLNGSRLMAMVLSGELEGRNLITLTPYMPAGKKNKWHIKARSFSWYVNRYDVIADPTDIDEVQKIIYKSKTEDKKEKTIEGANCVYVKLGGTDDYPNETTNRIHRALTDIENFSRAKYDLRKNTHIFGKSMPYWETQNAQAAKVINDAVNAKEWDIGTGYAGTAKFSLVEPSGGGSDAITKDIIIALKSICAVTGVPVHWMSWPELMSNRATADNLMEVVKAATQKERLIWEEAFAELIRKAMELAADKGIAGNEILGEFTVKLPLVSIALLQQMIDIWEPLREKELISDFTFMNMLPGINPTKEAALIKEQKERQAKESPMQNKTVNDALKQMQNKNNPLVDPVKEQNNDNDAD